MNQEPDLNVVIAQTLSELIKSLAAEVFSGFVGIVTGALQKEFENYLEVQYRHCKLVKTIYSKDKPLDFEEIYVPNYFALKGEVVSDNDLISDIRDNKRILVQGIGGSGKSFFSRFLWLSVFKEPQGRIPILVELRKLNKLETLDLATFIRGTISPKGNLSEALFGNLCQSGKFIFVLDGFDEVIRSKRDQLEQQIIEIARRFENCGMVVLGRGDDRFGAWQDFYCYKPKQFTREQAISLISKSHYQEGPKRKFIKLLSEEFFEQNRSFLANPLLCIIMLMTYHDNADIPDKMHVFYDNAFTTLFNQHDATKESYSRDRVFDKDTFRKLFSIFCFNSYMQYKTDFSDDELGSELRKAIEYTGIPADQNDLLFESHESLNLLIREGLSYFFVHRSFQEYFAAFSITNIITHNRDAILSNISSRTQDSVLRMIHDINQEVFFENYLFREYDEISHAVKSEGENAVFGPSFLFVVSQHGPLFTIGKAASKVYAFERWGSDVFDLDFGSYTRLEEDVNKAALRFYKKRKPLMDAIKERYQSADPDVYNVRFQFHLRRLDGNYIPEVEVSIFNKKNRSKHYTVDINKDEDYNVLLSEFKSCMDPFCESMTLEAIKIFEEVGVMVERQRTLIDERKERVKMLLGH